MLRTEVDRLRVRSPDERSNPMIETLRYIFFLPRLTVIQHQPEAVALVSRTLLGAVCDVLAIRRIQRRRVAGWIVRGNVFFLGPKPGAQGVARYVCLDD